MFNEKNIPKLIILVPIFTIIILVTLILYSFIKTRHDYFIQESAQLEKNYVKKQKVILQEEINDIFQYIKYHKNLMINNEKENIKIQMKSFIKTILSNDITPDEYKIYIKEISNDDTDFIIYDIQNHQVIKNKNVFFNLDTINNHKNIDGNFILQDETNLFFFKIIPSKNLVIILKKDIFYKLDNLKDSIARWVELIRFEKNNYLWIYSNTNKLIADPYRKNDIGQDDTYKRDIKNTFFVQKLVRLAIKNPNGSFFEFYSSAMNKEIDSKKVGFVKLYKEWNWIIGSGIYINEIQKNIATKKLLLEKTIDKYIKTTILIASIFIVIISFLSILTSYKISNTFQRYKHKVNRKELKLKYLNRNLHSKIEVALKEEKEKDRAMLHQSRLARMGEMLSMISHQWRQPLNKLNSIMMELETKILFKKATDEFLVSCVDDATETIQFMSSSMEDFKNFYTPSKDKESFYISTACKEAISLMQASLDSTGVKLDFIIKDDIKIRGYKREYSQVVLNIILNAKDALVSNNVKEKKITLSIEMKDKFSLLRITDNAGGIKEEIIDLIFDPYFSTKKMQGTGLGLYMSKMIIEKSMQGKLSVKNDSFGAVFEILL